MTPSKGPFHVETDEKGHTERKSWTPVCLSISRGCNESPLKFPFITKSTKLLLSQVCGSN